MERTHSTSGILFSTRPPPKLTYPEKVEFFLPFPGTGRIFFSTFEKICTYFCMWKSRYVHTRTFGGIFWKRLTRYYWERLIRNDSNHHSIRNRSQQDGWLLEAFVEVLNPNHLRIRSFRKAKQSSAGAQLIGLRPPMSSFLASGKERLHFCGVLAQLIVRIQ